MAKERKIEIYSAECPICKGTIDKVVEAMCPSCEVVVLDMHDPEVAEKAKNLGIRAVPAVVVDGTIVDGYSNQGVDIEALKAADLGKPIK